MWHSVVISRLQPSIPWRSPSIGTVKSPCMNISDIWTPYFVSHLFPLHWERTSDIRTPPSVNTFVLAPWSRCVHISRVLIYLFQCTSDIRTPPSVNTFVMAPWSRGVHISRVLIYLFQCTSDIWTPPSVNTFVLAPWSRGGYISRVLIYLFLCTSDIRTPPSVNAVLAPWSQGIHISGFQCTCRGYVEYWLGLR